MPRKSVREGKLVQLIFLHILSFLTIVLSANILADDQHAMQLSSEKITDGSLIRVSVASQDSPAADFEGMPLYFFPSNEPGHWEALFGIAHNHKPETTKLIVRIGATKLETPLTIEAAQNGVDVLKVDPRQVNPTKKDMFRIKRDIHDVALVYASIHREKRWHGLFRLPIESQITSVYGTRRIFNGEERSYHNGLDLKAQVGTPVHAAADGVIAMAKDLFFTGNTVLIDHGYGVISLYAHLSKLEVKSGQSVHQGDVIGLSGKTGRASGPHLHWAMIVNKVKVDPAQAIQTIR